MNSDSSERDRRLQTLTMPVAQSLESTEPEPESAATKVVQDDEELRRTVDFNPQLIFVFDATLEVRQRPLPLQEPVVDVNVRTTR